MPAEKGGGHSLTLPDCVLPAHAGPPSDDNNVFVKGFDRSQGEDAVREALTTLFSEAGEVANVRLPTDRETGELKGFGFIEFADNAGKVCWVT